MATIKPSRTFWLGFGALSLLPISTINDFTVVLSSRTTFKKNNNEKNDIAYKYYQPEFDQWTQNSQSNSKSKSQSNSHSNLKSNLNSNKSLNTNAWIKKIPSMINFYMNYIVAIIITTLNGLNKGGLFLSVPAVLEKILEIYNGDNDNNKENDNYNENTQWNYNTNDKKKQVY